MQTLMSSRSAPSAHTLLIAALKHRALEGAVAAYADASVSCHMDSTQDQRLHGEQEVPRVLEPETGFSAACRAPVLRSRLGSSAVCGPARHVRRARDGAH